MSDKRAYVNTKLVSKNKQTNQQTLHHFEPNQRKVLESHSNHIALTIQDKLRRSLNP